MPRPKKTDRPVEKNISLPTSIVARCELEMYSELERKLPFGAWQKFLTGLINEHFARVDRRTQFALNEQKGVFLHLAIETLKAEGYSVSGYHDVD